MQHQAATQERAFSCRARIERTAADFECAVEHFEPFKNPWLRADRFVANLRRMVEAESIEALKMARQMGVPVPKE